VQTLHDDGLLHRRLRGPQHTHGHNDLTQLATIHRQRDYLAKRHQPILLTAPGDRARLDPITAERRPEDSQVLQLELAQHYHAT